MVHISLNYNTVYGEQLILRTPVSLVPMKFAPVGMWYADLESCPEEFGFEVWKEGRCTRKEWRSHRTGTVYRDNDLDIEARWNDRPSDSPFYTKLFTDVVFQRKMRRPITATGNVMLEVLCADIRQDQVLAIAGSGKKFGGWKKMIPLSDAEFPLWKICLDVSYIFEYKFVIVDKKTHEPLFWEIGPNRSMDIVPMSGDRYVLELSPPVFDQKPWRGAGTAVPVFSLRSEDSFGIGEFNDIRLLVDWAAETHQSVIQLLPLNDTTMSGTWQDSYPYNACTSFALHPQFIHLPDAGVRRTKAYSEMKARLNALPQIDYVKVNAEKRRLLEAVYRRKEESLSGDPDYGQFVERNREWLLPYAVYCCLRDYYKTADYHGWGGFAEYDEARVQKYASAHPSETGFWCFEQFILDRQLREVVAYAHSKGVALKGDLPIGVARTSVDTWQHPDLFNLDSQTGAPPDAFSLNGQNWGFPTYNWDAMARDGYAWWKARLGKMSEYFDAFRIDHILGFFRIWEIPYSAVDGLLGHFSPALPYSAKELEDMGFDMESGSYTRPLMASWVIERIFGARTPEFMAKYVRGGKLDESVDTQRKVLENVRDERIRKGLMELLDDVLFLEDPHRPGYYHPRISAQFTLQYEDLAPDLRDVYNRLYNDFFYHRHTDLWAESALRKLPSLLGSTGMLACGEDLGMIPECVPPVMRSLGVLSLEIQRMPKSPDEEFADPQWYPYYSVCATGSHDTSNIRAWWTEDRALVQRYYANQLGCGGSAPKDCEPWICEKIVFQHLLSPSMLCILPLQDWFSLDGEIRYQGDPADERINDPSKSRFYWRYRMHLTLDRLRDENGFNSRLLALVRSSGRG